MADASAAGDHKLRIFISYSRNGGHSAWRPSSHSWQSGPAGRFGRHYRNGPALAPKLRGGSPPQCRRHIS